MELHADSPAEVYGLLAHHFAEADEPARATQYLLKAANAARAAFAQDEAIELYRRALGFIERTGDEGSARDTLLVIALVREATGTARSRSSGAVSSSSRSATRTVLLSRPPQTGAARAETSAR